VLTQALGLTPYSTTWQAMKNFVNARTADTEDEIWFCEHEPVFTLGQAGKPEHILNAHNIPIVNSDRGGQVTYHGPGFLMVYCLFDINRLSLNTREFVCALETIVIDVLKDFNIQAYANRDAPGVYVDGAKVASVGLRLRKGYSYHGLCINVEGDLTPFSYINPCGIVGQSMTSLQQLGAVCDLLAVQTAVENLIRARFTQHSVT
jgi:lipoyl(octanoyl) transferase